MELSLTKISYTAQIKSLGNPPDNPPLEIPPTKKNSVGKRKKLMEKSGWWSFYETPLFTLVIKTWPLHKQEDCLGGYLLPREAQQLSAMHPFQKRKLKTSGAFLFFLPKEKNELNGSKPWETWCATTYKASTPLWVNRLLDAAMWKLRGWGSCWVKKMRVHFPWGCSFSPAPECQSCCCQEPFQLFLRNDGWPPPIP